MREIVRRIAEFEQAAPVLNLRPDWGLHPGLSLAEIEAMEAQCNIRLPDELRALYLWKSGFRSELTVGTPESMLWHSGTLTHWRGAEQMFRSGYVADVVLSYLEFEEDFADDPDKRKHLEARAPFLWAAFGDGCGAYLLTDIGGPPDASCPVYGCWKPCDSPDNILPLMHRSLADLVATVTACIESGAIRSDAQGDIDIDHRETTRIAVRLNPGLEHWEQELEMLSHPPHPPLPPFPGVVGINFPTS